LILACNSIGLSAFYVLYPERFALSGWVIAVVTGIAILTATMHWMLPSFSVVKQKRMI
jgi:hypothetical protein